MLIGKIHFLIASLDELAKIEATGAQVVINKTEKVGSKNLSEGAIYVDGLDDSSAKKAIEIIAEVVKAKDKK